MLYAILAYHVEAEVASWTPEEDAALMADLHRVHDRLNQEGRLGPAARLGATEKARTLRGPGAGLVIDGPFAEKGTVAGLLRARLRHRRSRHRGRARPAPRQPHRSLRDPSPRPLSSRCPFSDNGRPDRRYVRPGAARMNAAHLGGPPLPTKAAFTEVPCFEKQAYARRGLRDRLA